MSRAVLRGEYPGYLYESYPDAERRLEELDQLALFALNYPSPEAFLTELALTTNVDAETVVVLVPTLALRSPVTVSVAVPLAPAAKPRLVGARVDGAKAVVLVSVAARV